MGPKKSPLLLYKYAETQKRSRTFVPASLASARIILDDDVEKLCENNEIREFYVGLTGKGKKKSCLDVTHYKRLKRWLT